MNKSSKTHFGFKNIFKDAKESMVGEVFSKVAGKYDLMNDLMSFGTHRLWKDKMVEMVTPIDGNKIIDVAGGTGDIAFRINKKLKKFDIKAEIDIVDINAQMLEVGKERAIDNNIYQNLSWHEASGEKLPFKKDQFDFYTIAFGIRNFTNPEAGLKEAYRILKPGGKFICMEFAEVENETLRKIYDSYSFNVIPKIGKIAAQDEDSYQYLVESIRKFWKQDEFCSMARKTGFKNVNFENLSFGAVAIYTGVK